MQSPFLFNVIKVMLHHYMDKLLERCFCRIPAEGFLCFCRVAEESLNFRRAEIFRVNFYKTFASGLVVALFIHAFALELNIDSGLRKSALAEFPDTVLLACRNDKVIRGFLLKNQPHTFNVILGVPPVAERVKVSKIKTLLAEPFAIQLAARVIFLVTKVSPRRSDSWLKRIPFEQNIP